MSYLRKVELWRERNRVTEEQRKARKKRASEVGTAAITQMARQKSAPKPTHKRNEPKTWREAFEQFFELTKIHRSKKSLAAEEAARKKREAEERRAKKQEEEVKKKDKESK